METIKIFVSHRTDIDSQLIDNPIYYPMRCGAYFDEHPLTNLPGDDTGDNVSELKPYLSEFSVQYWAWKNFRSDYYGLCHYRRFLSFSSKKYKTDEFTMVYNALLCPRTAKKYGLTEPEKMGGIIRQYDIVTSEYAPVGNIPTPEGKKPTVLEMWGGHRDDFCKPKALDLMLQLIDERFPKYSKAAREYLDGNMHRGFNCYVMRKPYFEEMCGFQFSIMLEIINRLDMTGYTAMMKRTPAFIGEILYGIYIYFQEHYGTAKIHTCQLLYFHDTRRIQSWMDLEKRTFKYAIDAALRKAIDPAFPVGSKRREQLKDIYYGITGAKRMGPADANR